MNEKSEQRRIRKFQESDRAAIQTAIRTSLSSYEGRKLLWHLLEIGKIGTQPFNGNALGTSFACGELNVGQRILADILEVDPMAYGRMMQENLDEHTRRYPITNPDSDSGDSADLFDHGDSVSDA